MKKSVVATRACSSFSRQTAASSLVSVPTSRLAKGPIAGIPAMISVSTAGAILQPQPPPWASEVRRGFAAMTASVMQAPEATDPGLYSADEPWSSCPTSRS